MGSPCALRPPPLVLGGGVTQHYIALYRPLHSLLQLFCWRCRCEYWKTKCRSAGGHEWSCRASIIHSTWLIHICRDWEVAGQGVFGPAARSWLLVLLLRPQRFPLLGLRKNSNWAWRVNRFSVEVSLKPQRFHTCSSSSPPPPPRSSERVMGLLSVTFAGGLLPVGVSMRAHAQSKFINTGVGEDEIQM